MGGHGKWTTYKTSLVNNRGLDEEESPGNREDREESKGWRRLQAPEAALALTLAQRLSSLGSNQRPFCTALSVERYRREG